MASNIRRPVQAARLAALLVAAIVAGTFIAGLIVGAQRDSLDGPVDLIVFNGRVFTAIRGAALAEALAIQGNRILRVGSNREIKRLRRRNTTVVDAHGGTVLPGFNDARVHVLDGGLAEGRADLETATTLEDLEDRIEAFAEANPTKRWVEGRGWPHDRFADADLTRARLDTVVPDRPALMLSRDGQTVWVNSKALDIAGVTARTTSPKGGTIVKDARSGEPTGLLKGAASALVTARVPGPTREDRLRAGRSALRKAHSAGITSVQHSAGTPDDLSIFDELRRAGDLRVRIYAELAAEPETIERQMPSFDAAWAQFPDDPLLKTGAAHLGADAASVENANTPQVTAAPQDESAVRDALTRAVAMLDRKGWQIVMEAADERALDASLDAVALAIQSNPAPARDRRHRIDVRGSWPSSEVERLRQLGVVVGLSRADATAPSREGAPDATPAFAALPVPSTPTVLGSDWPALPLDPLASLGGLPSLADGSESEAAATARLAWSVEAATSGAAWAAFDETRKGTLAPGMLADVIVLSADIFAERAARLQDAVVTTTIFDGKVVYARESPNAGRSH